MDKTVKETHVVMHELILPNDTNNLDTVFGGKVMQYMDLCAVFQQSSFIEKKKMITLLKLQKTFTR